MSDQSSHHAMDPITFEVMKNALLNATEEMAYTIPHAARAYSTNIKTRADLFLRLLRRFIPGCRAVLFAASASLVPEVRCTKRAAGIRRRESRARGRHHP